MEDDPELFGKQSSKGSSRLSIVYSRWWDVVKDALVGVGERILKIDLRSGC